MDFTKQIDKGVAYLDEYEPGWLDVINTERLNLAGACKCILGQLADYDSTGAMFDDYVLEHDLDDLWLCEHGFMLMEGVEPTPWLPDGVHVPYPELTNQWKKRIEELKEQRR